MLMRKLRSRFFFRKRPRTNFFDFSVDIIEMVSATVLSVCVCLHIHKEKITHNRQTLTQMILASVTDCARWAIIQQKKNKKRHVIKENLISRWNLIQIERFYVVVVVDDGRAYKLESINLGNVL